MSCNVTVGMSYGYNLRTYNLQRSGESLEGDVEEGP
jgi:hypothetical protein